ncbi:MAG: DUF3011 domain-containing protein, partial [Blastocatellia bacterium]|nr:DUF3011 domain-containing protein [Blastocatellia bacterium]
WVDRGCRADFEVGRGGEGQYGAHGNRGEYGGNREGYGYGSRTITCESNNNRRNLCRADTRGGVRMVRQRSDSACIQGRTWGFNRDAIWVDRGCRADFQIGR